MGKHKLVFRKKHLLYDCNISILNKGYFFLSFVPSMNYIVIQSLLCSPTYRISVNNTFREVVNEQK